MRNLKEWFDYVESFERKHPLPLGAPPAPPSDAPPSEPEDGAPPASESAAAATPPAQPRSPAALRFRSLLELDPESKAEPRAAAADADAPDALPLASADADAGAVDAARVTRGRRRGRGAAAVSGEPLETDPAASVGRETREQLLSRLLDPVLSLEEAAQVLNVCPTTVRRYTNKGLLRHHRTSGNQRRFHLSHVLAFLGDPSAAQELGTLSVAIPRDTRPEDVGARPDSDASPPQAAPAV